MNLQDLKHFTTLGVGMALATRDAQLRPQISDVMGVDMSEDSKKIVIFISAKESAKTLANIKENEKIALSLARPCDYYAAQIKATVLKIRPISAIEQELSQEWAEKYRAEVILIGMTSEAAAGMIMDPDTALEAEITDLFIQTPGPVAGQPMEGR